MYTVERQDIYGTGGKRRRRKKGIGTLLGILLAAAVLVGLYRLYTTPDLWTGLLTPAETTSSVLALPPEDSAADDAQPDMEVPAPPAAAPELPGGGETDILTELQQRAASDVRFASILEQAELYPQDLLLLALKNEEAVDFVAAYPDHMEDTVAAWEIDLSGDCTPGTIPLLMQWDDRWGYAPYGTNLMGVAGCGPTCLSMVTIGLTGDLAANPLAVAEYSVSQGWYVDGQGTDWELMRAGAAHFGLSWEELPLDAGTMCQALDAGAYIIASMMPGDFTDSGHFVVIGGYDDTGFQVLDPNSREHSGQRWSYDTLSRQINNLWAYTA